MKKILILSIITVSIGVFFTACKKDFLETYPSDAVSSEVVVNNTDNAMAALNGIHRALYNRYESNQRLGGLGSWLLAVDEMGEDHVMVANNWAAYYQWLPNVDANSVYNKGIWTMFYKLNVNANVIINGIDAAEGSQSLKNAIKGEALVYRAYFHFNLVQTYAERYVPGQNNTQLGIPIKIDTSVDPIARASVQDVYLQINKDLDDAIVLLNGYSRVNKSHINQKVAYGLKARVNLTQGNWETAITNAQLARAGHTLMTFDTYKAGFKDNLDAISEFMWASHIVEDQTNYFGNLGAYLSRNYSSSAIRANPRAINSVLYNTAIPATDVRKTLFDPTGLHTALALPSNFTKKPFTSQKFLSVSTGDSRMDIVMMRAAEMYLIEAEAYARWGGYDTNAKQALYDLLITRNPNYVLSSNTGQALIDEIMLERRTELWGEGFRFYDLKRLNLPLNRNGANHNSAFANNVMLVPAGDKRWTFLIPQAEIDANPLMVQNPI